MDDLQKANQEAHHAWEKNAVYWDETMEEGNDFVNLLVWPAVTDMMDAGPDQRILEAACGNGLYARRMAALGAEVTAFDFSAAMVDRAVSRGQEAGPPIQYHVIDATDEDALLSLGERSFDSILCSMALFDMAEIDPLFRAAAKLLKPGGVFVFSVLHPCFNNASTIHVGEMQDDEGKLVTTYSVKISTYMTPTTSRGLALSGQPVPQLYFDRPISALLGAGFKAGFVVDALDERAFPPDLPSRGRELHWNSNFSDIPPVMVVRMRLGS